MIQSPSRTRWK